jgi:hypothetical protein
MGRPDEPAVWRRAVLRLAAGAAQIALVFFSAWLLVRSAEFGPGSGGSAFGYVVAAICLAMLWGLRDLGRGALQAACFTLGVALLDAWSFPPTARRLGADPILYAGVPWALAFFAAFGLSMVPVFYLHLSGGPSVREPVARFFTRIWRSCGLSMLTGIPVAVYAALSGLWLTQLALAYVAAFSAVLAVGVCWPPRPPRMHPRGSGWLLGGALFVVALAGGSEAARGDWVSFALSTVAFGGFMWALEQVRAQLAALELAGSTILPSTDAGSPGERPAS